MAFSPDFVQRRLVIGCLFVFLLSSIGGLVLATQSVASAYQYRSALGRPIAHYGATPVYAPWMVFEWHTRFRDRSAAVFAKAQVLAGAFVILPLALTLFMAFRYSRRGKASVAHGSARWATTRELRRARFLDEAGVVLAQTDNARLGEAPNGALKLTRPGDLIRDNSPSHVLIFAPTRSGKGAGVVVPTLLTWVGSMIAWDIKRELWCLTAGWRSTFSHCWRFEPAAEGSAHINPLTEIRLGSNEVRDTQGVAEMLVDPDGKGDSNSSGGNEKHFRVVAQSLLVGVILHILYAEKEKSLPGVVRFLADPQRAQSDTLSHMLNTKHIRGAPHPVVASVAREMLNKDEVELSGVFSTALAALSLYRDPLVARATSCSDFRFVDLMRSRSPHSLYLVVSPPDLDRLRPLMRLVLNQISRRLTEENESGGGTKSRHRLLMMLDEFPSLGQMPFLANALAYLAGYGIKCVLIAQSLNQLEEKYGAKNSIIDNCDVRLTYRANDDHTADRISKFLGPCTYRTVHESTSTEVGSFWGKRQKSSAVQEHARPLLTPGEVLQLPRPDALLLAGDLNPYRARKVVYYDDRRFKSRASIPPPMGQVDWRSHATQGVPLSPPRRTRW